MNSSPPRLDLQPSASKRWLSCRGSPGFLAAHAAEIPDEPPASWTQEGIEAHELAAALLRGQPLPEDTDIVLATNVMEYVKFVQDKVGDGALMVEQKVPLFYMPDRHGYIDAGIVNTQGIYIADYKNGEGVSVEAKENSQLAIYGLSFVDWLQESGLYVKFPGTTLVTLAIYQPRARDKRTVRIWALTLEALEGFCHGIDVVAQGIQDDPDHQPFAPSDDNCRFCPASRVPGLCPHRTGQLLGELPPDAVVALQTVQTEKPVMPDVNTFTPEQLGRIVRAGGALKKFIDGCRDRAFALANAGTPIPGCKLVEGKTNRAWVDLPRAEELLRQKFSVDEVAPRSFVSPAGAEKLLKGQEVSTRFKNLMSKLITKPPGEPTLVSADDPRPAFDLNPVSELKNLNETSMLE